MKPTVGRIVHYTNLGDKDGRYPPEQQAAIITGVYPRGPLAESSPTDPAELENWRKNEETLVDLHIFYRTGQFDMQRVPFSEVYERGHWSWPPKIG